MGSGDPPLYGSAHGGRSPTSDAPARARPSVPRPCALAAACALHAGIRLPTAIVKEKSSGYRNRSPERLAALAAAARRPRGLRGPLPERELISEPASRLDAFSGYPFRARLRGGAVGRQPLHRRPVRPGPLVLGAALLNSLAPAEDRDRTVSRRSEPSSRTALNGEQPYPWDLLQPQDAMSRHRGAKPCRRCGLLGKISLLSPEYLLSVERRPFHSVPPDH